MVLVVQVKPQIKLLRKLKLLAVKLSLMVQVLQISLVSISLSKIPCPLLDE